MYTPRASSEITRDLVARLLARTTLTDIAEGSVVLSLLQTFAEQIAEADVRLSQIRDQFTLNGAGGVDLDERAEEIGITRFSATRATGEITVFRESATSAFTVPRGAVFGRTDNSVTYITTDATIMGIGVTSINVAIQSSVTGSIANAPARSINVLSDVPDEITSIIQSVALSNGIDIETDVQLRARATRYLNSLARCQPIALEYLATSFIASDETRATTAKLYEVPTERGRCELLIDDGSGLADHPPMRAGANVTTILNAVQGQIIGVESPIVNEITVTDVSNLAQYFQLVENVDYIVYRERGLIHLLEGARVQLGTELWISNYNVYTGLIAELQHTIEGNSNDITSGYRPAGISVRVLPAPVERIAFDVLIVVYDGANVLTVSSTVESEVLGFISSLGAGDPCFIAQIIDVVMGVSDVKNVTIYRTSTRTLETDFYPQTPRTVLRGGQIRAVTSITAGE